MAFMVVMEWPGVTTEKYDAVRAIVDWEHDLPVGAIAHVAAYDGASLRVTDIWESPEQYQAFVESRLMPGVQQVGITTQPKVDVYPAHAVFIPGLT